MVVSRLCRNMALVLGLSTLASSGLVYADGLAADYNSLPPLISNSGATENPNVLLMLDTSESMQEDVLGNYVGSNNKDSRTVIARQAIAQLLDRYKYQANMGLMAFQPSPGLTYARVDKPGVDLNGDGTADYTPQEWWFNSGANWPNSYQLNSGFLYIPIGSIDPGDGLASTTSRLQDFQDMLGLSVVTQAAPNNGFYNLFEFSNLTYLSSTDYTNHRIVTEGSTPLAGAFTQVGNYYDAADTGVGIDAAHRNSSIAASDAVWPKNQCDSMDFAILLTDGVPTVYENGVVCTKSCVESTTWTATTDASGNTTYTYDPATGVGPWVTDAKAKAAALEASGVRTYVIGLGMTDQDKVILNEIAASAGTENAYFADNVNGLMTQFDSILADIANRTASGTGTAVVANRGSGLSADIQALFTPKKSDGNKIVNWVGTLHAMFIDDKGMFREDTNQDGLLGDYSQDRILDFVTDPITGTTKVNREISTSATDPTAIDSTQTITSDIEDIASIWNTRDRLAALTDVLTQRPYATPANLGRRLYTSTNGTDLLDFVQIDAANLSSLEQNEADLRAQIDALDKAIYGDPANPAASYSIDGLTNLLNQLTTQIALNGTVNGVPNIDLMPALQNEIDSVRSAVNSSIGTEQSNLSNALTAESNALGALNAAQADLAAKQQTLTDAQGVLDQAILDKATADQAVIDADTAMQNATTARDNAQTALNTAISDQSTAQSDRDTAAGAVTSAQTTFDNADSALTTANTDLNTADGNLTQANTDFNSAQTAANTAQTNYDNAVAAKAQADSDAAAALSDRNDAAQKLQDAQDKLAILEAMSSPPANPQDLADAQLAVADAQAAYDTADADYQAAVSKVNSADQAVTDTSAALSTANSNLTTATTDRNNAQGIYDQAVLDQSAAQTAYNQADADLTAANNTLTAAEQTLTDANQAVLDRQSDLATAQNTLDTATNTYNAALTTQSNTGQAVTDATTARDTAQGEVNTATSDVSTAQGIYDTAVTDRQAVDSELVRLNNILAKLTATENWASDVTALVADINALIAQLNTFGSLAADGRQALIDQLNALYAQLNALISAMPTMNGDAETAYLEQILAALNTELSDVAVLMNDQQVDPLDSVAESIANIDSQMTAKEDLEGQLYTVNTQIDQLKYVQYMDDNIPGQTNGDVDLSYDQRSSIVGWVRGEETAGLRNRTIDFDGDGVDEVWRLGDIVHSTPAVVGRPLADYYTAYGDTTYRTYMLSKFNRRQMVYVGGNDGILHAVNGGFWDDAQKGYVTQLSGDTATAHPLGSEIWGYVPKSVLPLLQFVADPSYNHMALIDGSPQVFDVNIFANDAAHPGGWGTILVVTMRMGGGEFTVRVDENDDGTTEDVVIRPSVMVFDITDPESEPTLIAELTDPEMGFTLGRPALVKNRVASPTAGWAAPDTNRWMLVFGSGPTDLSTATSDQQARMYAYDLNARAWADDWNQQPRTVSIEAASSFIGDMRVVDWDTDFVDDDLYFGVNTGTSAAPGGQLGRLRLRSDQGNTWLSAAAFGTLFDGDRSITGAPLTKNDIFGRQWIYFGTGRLLVSADNGSTQQEYFIGLREPVDADGALTYGSVSYGDLTDITNVEIYTNPDKVVNGPNASIDTFSKLMAYINETGNGWLRKLTYNGTDPSGRSSNRAVTFRDSVIFTEYVPGADSLTDMCVPSGQSYLWLINYLTGTAFAGINFGLDNSSGLDQIMGVKDMGQGMLGELAEPIGGRWIHTGDVFGGQELTEMTQVSPSLRRQSWRQIFNINF